MDSKDQIIQELTRRLERMEASREIQNVLARYVNYHSASNQEKTVELFCRHTPGIRLIFNGHMPFRSPLARQPRNMAFIAPQSIQEFIGGAIIPL